MKNFHLFFVLMFLFLGIFFESCKKKVPDNFYGEKDDLLQSILSDFDDKDYENVLAKLDRYRVQSMIDQDSVATIERLARINLAIEQTKDFLGKGDYTSAVAPLRVFEKSKEFGTEVTKNIKSIQDMEKGEQLLVRMKQGDFSDEIFKSIQDFDAFVKNDGKQYFSQFVSYRNKRFKEAEQMRVSEHVLATQILFYHGVMEMKQEKLLDAMVVSSMLSLENNEFSKNAIQYFEENGLYDY